MTSTTLETDHASGTAEPTARLCDKPALPPSLSDYLAYGAGLIACCAVVSGLVLFGMLTGGIRDSLVVVISVWVLTDTLMLAQSWRVQQRTDSARRARLAIHGVSLPVTQFRVDPDVVRHEMLLGKKSGFRIAAQFRGSDGHDYEAYSDMYERDPGNDVDFSQLRVRFDAEQPTQSMVDAPTAPAVDWRIGRTRTSQ